jgi:hypothetical protein
MGKNVAGIAGGVVGWRVGCFMVYVRAIPNIFLFVLGQAMTLEVDKMLLASHPNLHTRLRTVVR